MIKYPYLPKGKKINYVDASNKYMNAAKKVRDTESTDLAFSTGAVIVKNNKIIGQAGNKAGYTLPFMIKLHANGLCFRRMLKIKSGQKYWLCPGCATNKKHAENMAIKDAITKGNQDKLPGADLYLYGHWWCCEPCWNAMINAGIKNVYLLKKSEVLFNLENPDNIIRKKKTN